VPDYPEDLKYTSEHEWVRSGNGSTVRVGITEYAADQLGDIVFVTPPAVGEDVSAGDACGELESTKSVSDIFCPVSGVVSAVNPVLETTPESINADPYGDGWLFELEITSESDLDDLLDADAYAEQVEA
jgi:glycine cleavage system H protein